VPTPRRHTIAVPTHPAWQSGRQVATWLLDAGYETYAVGGCVRDLVLQREIADVDLATAAAPETVEKIVHAAGAKTVAVGKSFGVILVVMPDGAHLEVATFRNDGVYVDGRRPLDVVFADAFSDVERRDFTINALLLDLESGIIIDHVGGLDDLEQRRLRTVGNPQRRFAEDHLRVLRALRFAAHLDLSIAPETWAALTEVSLAGLARERIIQEWRKAVSHPGRARWFRASWESGVLARWCPPLADLTRAQVEETVIALARLPAETHPLVAMACTLLPSAGAAGLWLGQLPLANHDEATLRWLLNTVAQRERLQADDPITSFRILQAGPLEKLICLLQAWSPQWPGLSGLVAQRNDPRVQIGWLPCVSAKDLLAQGWLPGPALGDALRQVADAELAGQVIGRTAALAWLQRHKPTL